MLCSCIELIVDYIFSHIFLYLCLLIFHFSHRCCHRKETLAMFRPQSPQKLDGGTQVTGKMYILTLH